MALVPRHRPPLRHSQSSGVPATERGRSLRCGGAGALSRQSMPAPARARAPGALPEVTRKPTPPSQFSALGVCTPRPPRNPSPRPPRTVAAVAAREPFGALAHVARVRVHAGARVLARRREAGVGRRGASCKKDSGHQGRRHSSRGHLCARAEQVEAWGLLHSSLPRGAPKARGGRGLEMRPPAHLLAKPGLFQTPSCCFFLG